MDSQHNASKLDIVCQKVSQYNVDFLIGKITAKDLMRIATVNHRAIVGFDDNGMPIYNNNIQRKPSSIRVDSIKSYLLKDEYACFPSGILLSVPSGVINEEINDDKFSLLSLDLNKIDLKSSDSPVYLQIFDGQHRFKGMQEALAELTKNEDYSKLEKLNEFEFVVSFFIDATIEFQAMLFSTINRTPVKVSQDLVFDLFGLTAKDSPQKTSLAITLQLNGTKNVEMPTNTVAPFYKRIRLLAKKAKGEFSPISQGMFIRTIITLISPNIKLSEEERNYSRRAFEEGGSKRTIFRDFYAQNNDNLIFLSLLNYFSAAKKALINKDGQSWWEPLETVDNPMQRTIGFLALIDLLIEIFPLAKKKRDVSIQFFEKIINPISSIKLLNNNGNSLYPYSSDGKMKLSKDLIELVVPQTVE